MGMPTTYSRSSEERERSARRTKSPMQEVLQLLEQVEIARQNEEELESELARARQATKAAEEKVAKAIQKLDPRMRARFERMMGGIVGQEYGDR